MHADALRLIPQNLRKSLALYQAVGGAPSNQPKDWVFASTRKKKKGKQPYSPDSLLKRSIRPAAARAKIVKHIAGIRSGHLYHLVEGQR